MIINKLNKNIFCFIMHKTTSLYIRIECTIKLEFKSLQIPILRKSVEFKRFINRLKYQIEKSVIKKLYLINILFLSSFLSVLSIFLSIQA